jgi:purine nucleosidase
MSRKIIIDTDPGQDDAVAILLALASPELEVLGLTAVAGNVPLPLTHAERPPDRANWPATRPRSTPAATRPWRASSVTAEYVHGKTGLDGITAARTHDHPCKPGTPSIS